jgi:hypothetical protein
VDVGNAQRISMSNLPAVQQDSVIVSLVRASTALAEARTIQQTKSVLDVAAAAEIYAKRQQLGEEAIGIAHSIKIEALRKLGEMLKATPRNEGAKGIGASAVPKENRTPTLADLGLDKKTAMVAQQLTQLTDDAFEQVREGHETIAKALNALKPPKATPPPAEPAPDPAATELAAMRKENGELHTFCSEQGKIIKELLAENESLGTVDEADDKLSAALAEAKKFREINRILEGRIVGLQNEVNECKRAAKSWQAKFLKLEKSCKKS